MTFKITGNRGALLEQLCKTKNDAYYEERPTLQPLATSNFPSLEVSSTKASKLRSHEALVKLVERQTGFNDLPSAAKAIQQFLEPRIAGAPPDKPLVVLVGQNQDSVASAVAAAVAVQLVAQARLWGARSGTSELLVGMRNASTACSNADAMSHGSFRPFDAESLAAHLAKTFGMKVLDSKGGPRAGERAPTFRDERNPLRGSFDFDVQNRIETIKSRIRHAASEAPALPPLTLETLTFDVDAIVNQAQQNLDLVQAHGEGPEQRARSRPAQQEARRSTQPLTATSTLLRQATDAPSPTLIVTVASIRAHDLAQALKKEATVVVLADVTSWTEATKSPPRYHYKMAELVGDPEVMTFRSGPWLQVLKRQGDSLGKTMAQVHQALIGPAPVRQPDPK